MKHLGDFYAMIKKKSKPRNKYIRKLFYTKKLWDPKTGKKADINKEVLKPEVSIAFAIIKNFFYIGLIYGLMLNFIFTVFASYPFNILTIFAFGWTFWFIKYEIANVVTYWKNNWRKK